MEKDSIIIHGMSPYFEVFDMPTSLKFYRDTIGFKLEMQSTPERGDDCDWVLLKWQGIQLMLNTMYEKENRPVSPEVNRKKGHSDVVLYFGTPDIDTFYSRLKSKGVELKEPYITGYGFKAISLKDPDGYGLCFHWPQK